MTVDEKKKHLEFSKRAYESAKKEHDRDLKDREKKNKKYS